MSENEQVTAAARPWGEGQTPRRRDEAADFDEIDLREYLVTLWRYRRMILAVVAAAVLVAAGASFLITPVYELHTTLGLAQYPSGFYTNPGAATEVLASTDFLGEVTAGLNLPRDRRHLLELAENLEVKPVEGTNLLKISLRTGDPATGRALLEKMVALYAARSEQELAEQRDLLRRQLATVEKWQADVDRGITELRQALAALPAAGGLEAGFQRAQLATALQGLEQQRLALLDRYLGLQKELTSLRPVQVVQKAEQPLRPVRPRPALNVAVALVLGLMVAVLAAFAREYFRRPTPLDYGTVGGT
ncbi:MAG: hypothetical protein H5U01_01925 [Clostridia bacterium]|nr:hypothetical protein [Clostridia bacterium]